MRVLGTFRVSILLAVFVLAGRGFALAGTISADRDFVERNLICQCGCTMVVNVCTCSWADQARADIENKLKQGITKEQIIREYVNQYGEKILSAPTKKGFNLTAWLTPFIAVLVGGCILFVLFRRWVRMPGSGPAEADTVVAIPPEEEARYRARLEDELRKNL